VGPPVANFEGDDMDREKIAEDLNEWCGGVTAEWPSILRDLAFACSHDPALLQGLVGYLKREALRERRARAAEMSALYGTGSGHR